MLKIDPTKGLLLSAHYHPSPNFDERPTNQEIDLLVIHNISLPPGEFAGDYVQAFFSNNLNPDEHPYFEEIAAMQVSSHLYIRRNGEVWQFVPFNKRAWHAGKSCFAGEENCNNFSIGIELEGTDSIPYTQAQYQQLAHITCLIMQDYPKITLDRIVGHSDIAPMRKTDPGPSFQWQHYKELVQELTAA